MSHAGTEAFIAAFGHGPHICPGCDGEVWLRSGSGNGVVHHIDETGGTPDENNALENLQAMCRPCHASHHNKGKTKTYDVWMKGRHASAEHLAAIRATRWPYTQGLLTKHEARDLLRTLGCKGFTNKSVKELNEQVDQILMTLVQWPDTNLEVHIP